MYKNFGMCDITSMIGSVPTNGAVQKGFNKIYKKVLSLVPGVGPALSKGTQLVVVKAHENVNFYLYSESQLGSVNWSSSMKKGRVYAALIDLGKLVFRVSKGNGYTFSSRFGGGGGARFLEVKSQSAWTNGRYLSHYNNWASLTKGLGASGRMSSVGNTFSNVGNSVGNAFSSMGSSVGKMFGW